MPRFDILPRGERPALVGVSGPEIGEETSMLVTLASRRRETCPYLKFLNRGPVPMGFQVVLAFGDSITMGLRDDRGGWPARLWEGRRRIVYNLGVDGETSSDVLSRFVGEAKVRGARQKSIIVFSVGINDSSRLDGENRVSLEDYTSNLTQLLREAATQFTKNVFCVGLAPIDQSRTVPFPLEKSISFFDGDRLKYDAALKEVSGKMDAVYVPVDDLGLERHLSEDGVHPFPSGHELLARRIGSYFPAT